MALARLVARASRLAQGASALALAACGSGPPHAAVASSACASAPLVGRGALMGDLAGGDGGAPNTDEPWASERTVAIQNVEGRHARSLDGAWRAIVDPYDNGYYDYRGRGQTTDGYFLNRKPASKSDRVEYDFDRSDSLRVPGDWNSQRRELFLYEGTIWYKTDLDVRPASDRRVFAHFGAANYEAKVYLNGRLVGEHVGGFTPFDVELTEGLRDTNNFLVVQVDNRRRREGVPTINTDWWNYGGMTRDVALVDVPKTFILDYGIEIAKGEAHALTGWVKLDGPREVQDVAIRIPEVRGAGAVVRTDAHGFARFRLDASVDRWSPQQPKLYGVEIAAQTDRVVDRIGFRTIETRGDDVLLNGKPLFLRGISIHEQAPSREGRAYSVDDARTLLGWARDLGANFVRLAHYPHNEHMVRLADELGILVWSEIPVYWTIDWDNPGTLANAKNQLREMIARDKNRASVIIWSIGNETPRSDARLHFMSELARVARSLDDSRLLSAALEHRHTDPGTETIDDPLGEALDVIGCNEYLGWYDGLPEDADSVRWRTAYDKPLIMTELGAGALQGLHGDAQTRWTEEFQANVYAHQIAMLDRIPFLRGLTPWILADFRSPRRPLPGVQDFWNRKGLISDHGVKKQAFSVLHQYYERLAASGR